MILTFSKIVIIAIAISVTSVGITIGIVFVAAPVTNDDTFCRTVQDISALRLSAVGTVMLLTWAPPANVEFCTYVEYKVTVYDENFEVLHEVMVTDAKYIIDLPYLCGRIRISVVGMINGSPTNTITVELDTGRECEGTGEGTGEEEATIYEF